jgi:hypothetical protein
MVWGGQERDGDLINQCQAVKRTQELPRGKVNWRKCTNIKDYAKSAQYISGFTNITGGIIKDNGVP